MSRREKTTDRTKDLQLFTAGFDYDRLHSLAEDKHKEFVDAKPYPHICIDNFLNKEFYDIISKEHVTGRSASGRHSSLTKYKYSTERTLDKFKRMLFLKFGEPEFLKFLTALTGIKGLRADNTFLLEAGFTTIKKEGFLAIHKDFSHHRHTKLERRLNFFIYLNENWKDEYKGFLSLYDTEGNKTASYSPIANRCVIFQASDIAYHGHPEPLECPEDMVRRSFSIYYYTKPTGRTNSALVFQDIKNEI